MPNWHYLDGRPAPAPHTLALSRAWAEFDLHACGIEAVTTASAE